MKAFAHFCTITIYPVGLGANLVLTFFIRAFLSIYWFLYIAAAWHFHTGCFPAIKQKSRRSDSRFLLAGVLGFEPRKCQIQSLVPYRLAIPQSLSGNDIILLVFHAFVNSLF